MKFFVIDRQKKVTNTEEEINYKKFLDIFYELETEEGTSIKLYEKTIKEYIIQFSWEKDNQWKADYPIQLGLIHKQQYMTSDQAVLLGYKMFFDEEIENSNDLIDVPVQHFTLDEMLQFKKEEQMMLRGEDPFEHNEEGTEASTESLEGATPLEKNIIENEEKGNPDVIVSPPMISSKTERNYQEKKATITEQIIEEETSKLLLRPKKKIAALVSSEPKEASTKAVKEEIHTNSEEALLQLKPQKGEQKTPKVASQKSANISEKKENSPMLLKPKRKKTATPTNQTPKPKTQEKNIEDTTGDDFLLEI